MTTLLRRELGPGPEFDSAYREINDRHAPLYVLLVLLYLNHLMGGGSDRQLDDWTRLRLPALLLAAANLFDDPRIKHPLPFVFRSFNVYNSLRYQLSYVVLHRSVLIRFTS